MPSLDRTLRRELENTVRKARRVAEAGAHQALEQLAVGHHEPWSALTPQQRRLRNRLRAHGRQLGDRLDEKKGTQAVERLAGECAYEQWHRLLFARFLAENSLLVEPSSGMPVSLDECRELARERSVDWLVLASEFAQRMLPQIFRAGDPVLEVSFPPEKRQELEALLEGQARDVFIADDSLGWVYQFWQADEKERIDRAAKKIGANELSAVTQLFTEDYMVLFLLHNTLGSWWAGKVLAARPDLARTAPSETSLRAACALMDIRWEYLRFCKTADDVWRPAAGAFERWPRTAREISLLDPCMGSGHFLVFALPILAAMRMTEEELSIGAAVDAVLSENLFGLEVDSRCTQIAAFNLALAAWRMAGYRPLPQLHLACSGLSVGAKESEWLNLASGDARLEAGMKRLYDLFQQGPTLGSLVDPHGLGGDLLEAGFRDLAPLLEKAVARERTDEIAHEIAVTASGVARAAEILARRFTLVATNVPYLGRGKQDEALRKFCDKRYTEAKSDLATCFTERCLEFCATNGTTALVTPQSWLYLGTFKALRKTLLTSTTWHIASPLGPAAFQIMNWWKATTLLGCFSRATAGADGEFASVDASGTRDTSEKGGLLVTSPVTMLSQSAQLKNPDARVVFGQFETRAQMSLICDSFKGLSTGDISRYVQSFWERPEIGSRWVPFQGGSETTAAFGGRSQVLLWENGDGAMVNSPSAYIKGGRAWGRIGVSVNQMNLSATLYTGEMFDENAAAIIPNCSEDLPAIWEFLSSADFRAFVRNIDGSSKVTNKTMIKVPFDLDYWAQSASAKYPAGLPKPHSKSPTQWLFDGRPNGSTSALQVAVARVLGYRWPRQTGSVPHDCARLEPDELETCADEDGIVSLAALRAEPSAFDQVRAALAQAFGAEWSTECLHGLLKEVGFAGRTLDDWLREAFFEQHCEVFQQRPFVFHVWDGLDNGFGALVNYHRLAAPNGEGRRTLEKLIYTYLGDWIDRQRADQKGGVEGADGRVAAAEHLKCELEKILDGEPPYDIFVRWKSLAEQPLGWEPDIDDGVAINIRPFIKAKPLNARGKNACVLRVTPKIGWDKDRGKESHRAKVEYPWFWGWDGQTTDFVGGTEFDGNRWNDLHYSRLAKLGARERAKRGTS